MAPANRTEGEKLILRTCCLNSQSDFFWHLEQFCCFLSCTSSFCESPVDLLVHVCQVWVSQLSLISKICVYKFFFTCLASVHLIFLICVFCFCPNSESSSFSDPSYLLKPFSFASDFFLLSSLQPKVWGNTSFITCRNVFFYITSWFLLLHCKLSPT